jgi:hypothetical protein
LASKKVSIAELVFTDGMILLMTYALEHLWLTRHEAMKQIIYERIDLIKPQKPQAVVRRPLKDRLGVKVSRVEIGKIDLLEGHRSAACVLLRGRARAWDLHGDAPDDGDD